MNAIRLVLNLALVYVAYGICRLAYMAENWSYYADTMTWGAFLDICRGAWFFDTSAILYTNALFALMLLLPLHVKE